MREWEIDVEPRPERRVVRVWLHSRGEAVSADLREDDVRKLVADLATALRVVQKAAT